MKMKSGFMVSSAIAATLSFAGVASASQFNCGVFLDDEEKPAATARFDTASGQRTTMQAGGFLGFVQVNENNGKDEPLLLVGNAATDKTVSIAAYPMTADVMLTLLKVPTGKQAITTCVAAGMELVRPVGL